MKDTINWLYINWLYMWYVFKEGKHQITLTTFNKWQIQFDCNYNSLCWLRYEMNDNVLIEKCWCHTYRIFFYGNKKFSSTRVKGSTNQKMSNVVDHATSEQHTPAMVPMQADNAKASKVLSAHYAPIAKCFFKRILLTKERLKKKFDVCFLLAKNIWHFLSTWLY